jgi:Holliday junction resolvase-like predicted endonuclease
MLVQQVLFAVFMLTRETIFLNVETEMIISILKLTREGPISQELINKDTQVPHVLVRKLLQRLQDEGLIYVRGNFLEANDLQRLKIAILAVQSGADLERVSGLLQWKEFEAIAALAFERYGYKVKRNLRFTHGGRRWEIDIVGCRRPFVICVDCKHWRHGLHPSTLKRIVKEQVERTSALAESLPSPSLRMDFVCWDDVKFVPGVLSLVMGQFKFYDNVPVVSVLQLQDFLGQLPAYVHSLKYFEKSRSSLGL